MENYIYINGKKIYLTEEQVREITDAYEEKQYMLSAVKAGETVKIGDREFITLGHYEDETALIAKDVLGKMAFGNNNNFNGSAVEAWCESLAEDLANSVGERNIVEHTVDLTSDDGLKDYGTVQRKVSLLTTEQYRQYVDILDKYKPDTWWWLATPYSTPRHDNDCWVKCVSPSGIIDSGICNIDDIGVRPFCILKSSIFVSR